MNETNAIEQENDDQPMGHERRNSNGVRQEFAANSGNIDETGHGVRVADGRGIVTNNRINEMIDEKK
jgi:hypothetical protein